MVFPGSIGLVEEARQEKLRMNINNLIKNMIYGTARRLTQTVIDRFYKSSF